MRDLFIEGGVKFMTPIAIMLFVVLALAGIAAYRYFTRGSVSQRLVESIQQIGMLAMAWGVFSTVLGFFQALRVLSELKEPLPFHVIMGGLKVALITSLFGMIVFLVSFLLSIGLRPLVRKNVPEGVG